MTDAEKLKSLGEAVHDALRQMPAMRNPMQGWEDIARRMLEEGLVGTYPNTGAGTPTARLNWLGDIVQAEVPGYDGGNSRTTPEHELVKAYRDLKERLLAL